MKKLYRASIVLGLFLIIAFLTSGIGAASRYAFS